MSKRGRLAWASKCMRACCFLVVNRSISSTSSTVTRLAAAAAPVLPALAPPSSAPGVNMRSSASTAAAGEACFPVSACSGASFLLNQVACCASFCTKAGLLPLFQSFPEFS